MRFLAVVLLALAVASPAQASQARLTEREAIAPFLRHPKVADWLDRYPTKGRVTDASYDSESGSWTVHVWWEEAGEIATGKVNDSSGRVTEAWTGPQVAWKMARGYDGAFGGKSINRLDVWLVLCAVFLLGLVDWRRPLGLRTLDLVALLSFSVSLWFFNEGEIGVSVPLAYPVLLYVMGRMLWEGWRRRERAGRLVPHVSVEALLIGLVFLIGFRIGLNVIDSNVIDVGYSGVIGADRIMDGDSLYDGEFSHDNQSGNVYGPFAYLVYIPWEQLLPWHGVWDDLPAAHAAAITFDLLTTLGLYVLGVRLRGRTLGIALAYAWVAFPYSLFALSTNSNDTLIAALLVWALAAATMPAARGVLVGLASAAKFAPLGLVPLFATLGRPLRYGIALVLAVVIVVVPFLPDGGVRDFYDTTIGFHAGRESPFSIWGQEPGLDWLQTVLKVAVAGLALTVAFVPRKRDTVQVAALAAAVLIGLQLVTVHWFYLYIVWFAPLVLAALFAAQRDSEPASA